MPMGFNLKTGEPAFFAETPEEQASMNAQPEALPEEPEDEKPAKKGNKKVEE